MNKLKVNISPSPTINLSLNTQAPERINIDASTAGGVRNYNHLLNKPQINGVTLSGNQTLTDLNIVSENTSVGWETNPTYTPKRGEICLYTDTNMIKIGDGNVAIVDLPFISAETSAEIVNTLRNHISDPEIHVTATEKEFWNAKLNYDINGEELTFTRR